MAGLFALAACDEGPQPDEPTMQVFFLPYHFEHWGGYSADTLEQNCDQVAVISAQSNTAKRLLGYLSSGSEMPFEHRYISIKIVMDEKQVLVNNATVVTGLPDQPDRYIGYDALRKFEILFYKINPKYRKPCQSATQ